jgi:hypothetical protein
MRYKRKSSSMNEIRYIAGTLVGDGVERASLEEALKEQPHFIACDAGSTDPGPFSLGSGEPAFARAAVKRDLAALLEAGRRAGIPVLIGSAGTAGGDAQVDWTLAIVNEIVRALDAAPYLDEDTIKRSAHIVGMMGVEPLQQAVLATWKIRSENQSFV